MKLTFSQRLRSALAVLTRGSIAPFDRIGVDAGGAAPKLEEPAKNSAWVLRAIRLAAQPVASVPLCLSLEDADNTELEDPAVMGWLRKPALGMTRYDFFEATCGWLKLKECFWILDDSWLMPFPDPAKLGKIIIPKPWQMRALKDGDTVIGWEYTRKNGSREALLPEQVVHLKLWSPYDEERGSGDWPAAQVAAEADYASGQFALSLARNNGDTGPYIVPKAGPPAPEQIEQMKKQLLEKRYLNQSGKWAPTFMSADVDVVDPQIRVPDAAFYSGRVQNRDEIATAFGIPPSMFDKVASYSVGSASDYFKLINECCVPLAEKIADALEPLVSKLARQPVRARFNFDEHPTMQQVRAERTEAAKSYWGMGMPMAVINDWLNLGIPEYEGWDIGYLPFSVAPVSEERGAADDPGFDEANADDTEDASDDPEEVAASLRRAFDERAQARAAEAEADAGETFQDGRPEAELAQWESHMAKRRPVIKAYESAFTRELMKARAEVLAKLDAYSPPEKALEGARSRAVAADFLFDLEAFREGLLGALRKVAASALQLAGEDIFSELALDDPWQVAPEAVLNFIRRREVKLRDIPEEIAGRIRSALAEGIDAGESQPKLMTRIRGEFNTISKAKARTIAQTETSAAYGSGRQEAMEAAGVTHKKWLTSGNANVRPSHRAANGQTVPISSDYTVGGAHLSHPGDSTGPAGEVINCHCISIPTTAPTDE